MSPRFRFLFVDDIDSGGYFMKKFLCVAFAVLLLALCSCSNESDEVVASLGKYKSKEVYSSGTVQDFTDYARYSYDKVDFSGNKFFAQVTDDNKAELVRHIEDFEAWVDSAEQNDPKDKVAANYDFDMSVITDGDYVYIYDDPDYPDLGSYRVYFFDSETNTLCYFRNNV